MIKFAAPPLGVKYPSAVKMFEYAWERFKPFLAFPPELHRVIYTTNSLDSLHNRLRRMTKNRGQFPSEDAVAKMLWRAICNVEDKRARDRLKYRGRRRTDKRTVEGHLVEGQVTTNWVQALAQVALVYPDRINPHLEPIPNWCTKRLTGSSDRSAAAGTEHEITLPAPGISTIREIGRPVTDHDNAGHVAATISGVLRSSRGAA